MEDCKERAMEKIPFGEEKKMKALILAADLEKIIFSFNLSFNNLGHISYNHKN